MKTAVFELLKDLLILILVIAILALALLALPTETLRRSPLLSKLLQPLAGPLGLERTELAYSEIAAPALDAAQPLVISLRNSAGRVSAQYDFAALDSLYEALGSTLAQVLETAQQPQESTLTRFYEAAGEPGALLWYPASVPPSVLASWLGSEVAPDSLPARAYLLSAVRGENLRLYLLGEDCRVCGTQLSSDSFLELLDSYRPDGSLLALEDSSGLFSAADPLSVIPLNAPILLEASAANPCDTRFVASLATLLGFNPYGDAGYTDQQGNASFSETDRSLRVSAEGQVLLRSSPESDFLPTAPTAQARIEAARSLLTQLTASVPGDSRLYLSSYRESEGGAVCTFDYVLDGVPVLQRQGAAPAASVTFSGGCVTGLELLLRSYTLGSQPLNLIPPAQAAAIVPQGTRLRVCYDDGGSAQLTAGWVNE